MGRLRDANKGKIGAQKPRGPAVGDIQPPDRNRGSIADGGTASAPPQPKAPSPAPSPKRAAGGAAAAQPHSGLPAPADLREKDTVPPTDPGRSPPKSSPPSIQADDDFLKRLDPEAFRVLAREECRKHNAGTLDQAVKVKELVSVVMEIVRRGEAERIFPLGVGSMPPYPAPPPQRPSARPPPPARASKPPPKQAEEDNGPVSGFEATRAHPTGGQELPPPPKKTSKPPPPPKRTTKSAPKESLQYFSDLAATFKALTDEIEREVHGNKVDGTEKRLELAKKHFQAVSAIIRSKTKELMDSNTPDVLGKAQSSAGAKLAMIQRGQSVTLDPLEARILDINTLNGALGRLQETIKFLTTAAKGEQDLRRIKEANGHNAAEEEAKQAESRPPAEPPAQPPAPAQAKKGFFSRFLSNYWMPTSVGIIAFGAALWYNDKFRSIAEGFKTIFNWVSHHLGSAKQIADIPVNWVIGVYSGLMVALVLGTEIAHRIDAHRQAVKDYTNAQLSKSDAEKSDYIIDALKKIHSEHQKLDSGQRKLKALGNAITESLRSDDKLFEYVYDLRAAPIFKYILDDSRIPDKLHGPVFDELLNTVERERIQQILGRDFADLAGNETRRREKFHETYVGDAIFRKICDSLFARTKEGKYTAGGRAERIFKPIKDTQKDVVGDALLAGLRSDYDYVKSR